jgi:hypothetical protein
VGEGTPFEQCLRAIDARLTSGAHGLPLIGSGDWNDGLNRVGTAGRWDSTWLGFSLFQNAEPGEPYPYAFGARPGRKHLDGNDAIEARVPSLIHLAHAPIADGGEDLVGTELRARGERHE